MARIRLGTGGGKMSEVALRLEGEKRADIRQERQLRAQTSQFFAQLQQRKAEQQQRNQFQQEQVALTEEKMLIDEMSNKIREEGIRQQRSFGQAATNIELGSKYGMMIEPDPTGGVRPRKVLPGEGFEVAKTAKAQAKQQQLQEQIQNRTSQIMVAYSEFAFLEPETVNAMVMSSRTDKQLMEEIGQLAEKRESGDARMTLSDPASSPEQVIEALEVLQKRGEKTLWDHALEAEVDARAERVMEKDATHKALERQKANMVEALMKAKARAAGPSAGPLSALGRNDKAIAQAEVKTYTEELMKVNEALNAADQARLQRIQENPYQKIMADVIKEVYTGTGGVHDIHRQWSDRIGQAVQQLQSMGMTIASEGQQAPPGGQQPQQQPQQQQPQQAPQQPQGPSELQEGASDMGQFIVQEVSRIKVQIEQAEADLAEAEKTGNDRVVAAAKDQLMRAMREREAFRIQYGMRGGSLEEPESTSGRMPERR